MVEFDRDFQRKRREFQEDLNARKNEEFQQVLEKANRVVRQVAESEKYDLVLQEAVYINPKHDITDKVIKAINANAGNTTPAFGNTNGSGLSPAQGPGPGPSSKSAASCKPRSPRSFRPWAASSKALLTRS